jgi:hypothetical protein
VCFLKKRKKWVVEVKPNSNDISFTDRPVWYSKCFASATIVKSIVDFADWPQNLLAIAFKEFG